MDFCKAFNKVPYRHLKVKLEYYGIKDSMISSFLSGQTQHVVCGGSTSDPVDATSGVPQGTVLGPLLFLIYINDLPDFIKSSCSLFADNCLLYRKIETDSDHRALQEDLYNVEMWAKKWLMTFNLDKCEVMQISLKPQSEACYTLYNNQLKQVIEVLRSHLLTPNYHLISILT